MQTTSLKYFWLLSGLALLAVALPFWGIQSPALADHHNHLARFHILDSLESSAELQQFYFIREGFYPYMSIATFMQVFTPLMGLENAGRAFAILAIFMPVLGTLVLSKAVNNGKVSLLTLGFIPIAFSTVAEWGFLNFLFSTGLVLIIFAGWIYTAKMPAVKRVPLFAVLALLLTTMHLISVAFLGFLIGFWELYAVIMRRKIDKADVWTFTKIGLLFVPAGLLILTQLGGEFSNSETVYGNWGNKVNVLRSPMSMFSGHGETRIAQILLIGLIVLRSMKIISIDMRLIFVGFAMIVAGLIVPFQLFGVAHIGIRFPIFAVAVMMAGINDIEMKKVRACAAAMAVLIAAKLFFVHQAFDYFDTQTKELRAQLLNIPAGSKLLPVLDRIATLDAPIRAQGYLHAPAYNVIDRDGLFPYMFSMFNVGVKPEHAAFTRIWGTPVEIEDFDTPRQFSYADNWRENFDYVLVMDASQKPVTTPGLSEVATGSWFTIHKVEP